MDATSGSIVYQLAVAVIGVMVPIMGIYLKNLAEQNIAKAKAATKKEQYDTARGMVADLVKSAKARGLSGKLENEGHILRQYVINRAQYEFDEHGLPFNATMIADMLESAYIDTISPALQVITGELQQADQPPEAAQSSQ